MLGTWARAESGRLCQVPRVSILWGGNAGEHSGFGALMPVPSRQPALTAQGRRVWPLQPAMPLLPGTVGLAGLILWAGQIVNTLMPSATLVPAWPNSTALHPLSGLGMPHFRRKRHISARDMSALLDYHNHIRATVHPPAANMEYMVSPRALPSPTPGKCLSS